MGFVSASGLIYAKLVSRFPIKSSAFSKQAFLLRAGTVLFCFYFTFNTELSLQIFLFTQTLDAIYKATVIGTKLLWLFLIKYLKRLHT